MTTPRENLSDTRGNGFVIRFFLVALRLLGPRFCSAFIWPVAFFYALFDKKAQRAARPYIQSRFPDASPLARWWHFYRLIVTQGRAILLAHWARRISDITYEDVNPQYRDMLVAQAGVTPIIILLSHIGCWQAAVPRLKTLNTTMSMLIQVNRNPHIDALIKDAAINAIYNSDEFGGLLACANVLEKGEGLAIMGDRLPPDKPHGMELTLHGRTLRVPQTPWFLAARFHCPIFPVFTLMTDKPSHFRLIFSPPIRIDFDLPHKPTPELFAPFLKQYQEAFEKVIDEYPYQIFHFEQA